MWNLENALYIVGFLVACFCADYLVKPEDEDNESAL